MLKSIFFHIGGHMSEMNNTEKEQLLKELAAGYTGNEA